MCQFSAYVCKRTYQEVCMNVCVCAWPRAHTALHTQAHPVNASCMCCENMSRQPIIKLSGSWKKPYQLTPSHCIMHMHNLCRKEVESFTEVWFQRWYSAMQKDGNNWQYWSLRLACISENYVNVSISFIHYLLTLLYYILRTLLGCITAN